MNDQEEGVARHYGSYDVLARIRSGLEQSGIDLDHLTPQDLKAVDEFHIGGPAATERLLERLAIAPGMRVLDIGAGIGGPARTIALRFGAAVIGVDLTPAFVEAATALTAMCGMADKVRFEIASATALPFDASAFDVATLLHVGMNIPDKTGVFAEAARVLRAGGTFAVYDVMRLGEGELSFPVPWAETADLSALAAPDIYRRAARSAGFVLAEEIDRSDIALEFFRRIQAQAASSAPSPLGLHLLMGPTVGEKTANMIAAIKAKTIAPIEMIFRKPAS